MKHVICFIALATCLGFGELYAQDLKDLRALPDTSIIGSKKNRPLSIRNVNVPIPELGLSVDYWKHWTKLGLNLNQASFSDNWRDGGVNSVAWSTTGWHKSEFNKNDFNFTTEFDFRYGVLSNDGQLSKKNIDRIFWDNKLAYKFSTNWSIFTSILFESTFSPGYEYTRPGGVDTRGRQISAFMSPGYLTESLGLEYKPDETFSLRFGTGTARQTFVLDDNVRERELDEFGNIIGLKSAFGVEPGNTMRSELGFQLVANLDKNLSKNLNLKSRYALLADYQEISRPDHRLDATLTAKISGIVSVTANGILWYDRTRVLDGETNARVQYSQALSMGLLFAFPRQ